MHRFSFLGVALPVLALAACSDSSVVAPAAPAAPVEVIVVQSRGAVIAQSICAQCHGSGFDGATLGSTECPSLAPVGNYTLEEFTRLLFAGVARSGDEVDPLMTVNAEVSANDVSELLAYLKEHVDSE